MPPDVTRATSLEGFRRGWALLGWISRPAVSYRSRQEALKATVGNWSGWTSGLPHQGSAATQLQADPAWEAAQSPLPHSRAAHLHIPKHQGKGEDQASGDLPRPAPPGADHLLGAVESVAAGSGSGHVGAAARQREGAGSRLQGRATSSTLSLPSMLCYFFHAEERQGAPYILMQEAILTNNLDKNNSPISVPTVVWGELGPVCSLI